VIICGRREDKLREAQEKYPEMNIRVCDVAKETERVSLFEWATSEFPSLNVLINNAGIQRRLQLSQTEEWEETHREMAINLEAPVHLSILFIPGREHLAADAG
jgi:uncharacterized oxidoreductase